MPDTLNLLIVEDSDAERALLAAELASCPRLAPRMAASLHDAADAIATTPPDVVLLDLELPDARGLNRVEWLQRHHPALAVVVLSGFAADDLLVATEAIRQGAQDFLCRAGSTPTGSTARSSWRSSARRASTAWSRVRCVTR
ncbi:MAG: response regulator [Geminicoccaceae bacterium]